MENKQVSFKIKGMQRDLSESAFNPEFAFENMNIRITSRNDNTLLSITNELGNSKMKILDENYEDYIIEGITIGYCILNDYLVLFNTKTESNTTPDFIYKLWIENNSFVCKLLYNGSLDFNTKFPIETLPFYENENIQKVYWTDGLNSPRVINISTNNVNSFNDNSFNFVLELSLKEKVDISKNISGGGIFPPGTIQYAFTYYSLYGQESNIFYTSPLLYTSYSNRGGSPEDTVSNSFTITIKDLDNRFNYVRVYSISRTTLDAIPTVKRVTDLYISEDTTELSYTDGNTSGDIVDNSILLYVGGEDIIAQSFTHKDNTLFLGNLRLNRKLISKDISDKIKFGNISSNTRHYDRQDITGFYSYNNYLNRDSFKLKSFKYLEYYRCGILFQHKTGRWSEPIWINDHYNTSSIGTSMSYNVRLTTNTSYLSYFLNEDLIKEIVDLGYIKARPVIVYPEPTDREVIAQGILCPTVYNLNDRHSNAPFAQSSWFTRANNPFDYLKARDHVLAPDGSYYHDWTDINNPLGGDPGMNSKWGLWTSSGWKLNEVDSEGNIINTINLNGANYGSMAEFRHNYPIPDNMERNAEIQNIVSPPSNPYLNINTLKDSGEIAKWIADNGEYFYVDLSILTFHSPEIEFDDNVQNSDTSNLKLRIVGVAPITANAGDIDIQTSTGPEMITARGFYKELVGVENVGRNGYKGLMAGAYWFDDISYYKKDTGNSLKLQTGFAVYPWHRNGALNNFPKEKESDGVKAKLLTKKLSNLRYSFGSYYLHNYSIWNAEDSTNPLRTGISGVEIFNSKEFQSMIRVPAPKNSSIGDINYFGNIDKVLFHTNTGSRKDGYKIACTGVLNADENAHLLFSGNFMELDGRFTDYTRGVEPVRMLYKSTPHAVLALNYAKDNNILKQRVLPTNTDSDYITYWKCNSVDTTFNNVAPFWDKEVKGISQDTINIGIETSSGLELHQTPGYGYLWIAELYNDSITEKERFGGLTQEAFENNMWLPCGESVLLIDENDLPKLYLSIEYLEGDVYYQRYDCLKTYSDNLEAQNNVTDIVSFMCETRINIDGRYDRNRGLRSNFSITPLNFNLLNKVYSQRNNFFNYRAINFDKFNLDDFPNSVTWTKLKTSGEEIDTWTNITLASIVDLDGDKGEITSLLTLNDNIIAFLDKGIASILYNSRVQIPVSDGVPIEIGNSLKVEGKRYLSDKIGTTNKWSIILTTQGIYFMDTINKLIMLFNGLFDSISNRLGFNTWLLNNLNLDSWNPIDFNGFISYYDSKNKDIYFTNKDYSLSYSEVLGQFTSFFNYESVPFMFNISDRFISINNKESSSIWELNVGDYNYFFGEFKPYFTTLVVNPDTPYDKIFNTVEFRGDLFNNNELIINKTIDNIKVWNEYQEGESSLKNILAKPSNLKLKFRVWRANIPRDNKNPLLRIRNPWIYLRIGTKEENNNKLILHDITVHYTV